MDEDLKFLDSIAQLAANSSVRMEEARFKWYLPMLVDGVLEPAERQRRMQDWARYTSDVSFVAVYQGRKLLFIAPPLCNTLRLDLDGITNVMNRAEIHAKRTGNEKVASQAISNFIEANGTIHNVDHEHANQWRKIMEYYGYGDKLPAVDNQDDNNEEEEEMFNW